MTAKPTVLKPSDDTGAAASQIVNAGEQVRPHAEYEAQVTRDKQRQAQ